VSIRDEREPQSALARWDAAEAFHGERLVQPLVEDQSRFCLHPSADHGTLGCNTCGCPRSEDDHLGAVCRWPEPEDAKARDPWVWRPGMHTDRFPHGMAFEPKKAEPSTFAPWGSVANLMGEPRNNVALLFALGSEGEKLDDPLELLGPFHMLREDGRLVEFIAWGGLLVDHQAHAKPQCHEATGLWITRYNADGTLGETVHLPDTKATVCFAPPEESVMVRAARTFGPPLAQMAITFTQTIGPACRALVDMLAGVHPFKGRTGKVPPCRGLTRRQRAARRRIHRRRSR
jgi:hypothetical protein